MAIRLLGRPLDAEEHAAALAAAAGAVPPSAQPSSPMASAAMTTGRALLPAPTFSTAPTSGAMHGAPSSKHLTSAGLLESRPREPVLRERQL